MGMLRLIDIRSSGIRSLRLSDPFDFDDAITVLAGRNDAGKSSLIDSLGMLLQARTPSTEARSNTLAENEPIEVIGTFQDQEHEDEVASTIRIRALWSGATLVREQLMRIHPNLGKHPDDLNRDEAREKVQQLGLASPGGNAAQPYRDVIAVWLADHSNELVDTWVPAPRALLDRLPSLAVFDPRNPKLQVDRLVAEAAKRIIEESEDFTDRLATISDDLNEAIAPNLAKIRSLMKEYCLDMDDVLIDATFNFAKQAPLANVTFVRDGKQFLFEGLGDGQRQRAALGVYASQQEALDHENLAETEFVIAYDEPDSHLDYHAQRQLFDILEAQGKLPHVRVLVATHSANFIDKLPTTAIRHLRNTGQQTVLERIRPGQGFSEEDFLSLPRFPGVVGCRAHHAALVVGTGLLS